MSGQQTFASLASPFVGFDPMSGGRGSGGPPSAVSMDRLCSAFPRTHPTPPMPTVPGTPGPYRFFFYSFDCNEPPHVHARRDRATCKFWLDPVALAGTSGFAPRELRQVHRLIFEHRIRILEAWREHCGETGGPAE